MGPKMVFSPTTPFASAVGSSRMAEYPRHVVVIPCGRVTKKCPEVSCLVSLVTNSCEKLRLVFGEIVSRSRRISRYHVKTATLRSVTTLVLIFLFPTYNNVVHGHENDPVLKLRRLHSFFLQHVFHAFEDFDRCSAHVNHPLEFD